MKRLPLLALGIGPCVGLGLVLACTIARADPPLASQPRTVPAFHAVDLAGTLEVTVTAGKPQSVEVTGDADLLDKVITTVKDGVLILKTAPELDHQHRRNTHLRAVVSAPDLSALTISGTGAMTAAGIANEQLSLDLSGTGALTAAGSTTALHVAVAGTGEIAAGKLAAKDVVVDIGGTGAARLNATRSVEAKVTGTGSVDVHGHPAQVKKSVSGLGSIHVH
jgi:hypothetical protein